MVAYSFAPMFVSAVVSLAKKQTIRAPRARHARESESIQLYTGMRTKHCRKLIEKDPVCVAVRPITIAMSELVEPAIASIQIDGWVLSANEIEALAILDGFAPETFNKIAGTRNDTARANMGWFWTKSHGVGRFEGVLIEWETR